MEVHAPEHAIRTWRDFLVHIATIVIGLLIAIGLEQTVELVHHRHLVEVARRDLRNEMIANSKTLDGDEQHLSVVRAALLRDLQNVRGMQAGKAPVDEKITATWAWDGLGESAFNTARDTGAFAFMPYGEVQDLDMLYRQQQHVRDAARTYIDAVNDIGAPLEGGRTLGQISAEERERVIDRCSEALLDIDLLRSFMASLHSDYRRLATESGE